jgi:hypothetical protein
VVDGVVVSLISLQVLRSFLAYMLFCRISYVITSILYGFAFVELSTASLKGLCGQKVGPISLADEKDGNGVIAAETDSEKK